MKTTTMFTWGYYGWGNATPSLVKAVDAVETSRGFKPPIFVDIRIRRTVRAIGFQGNNFEKLLGRSRYRWMKSLGNMSIVTKHHSIEIADPSAAEELLDLALTSARNKQRLLYFCSCQWPRWNDEFCCHRTTVARLVVKAARKRGTAIEIVEWPGGKSKHIDLNVTPEVFASVRRGRMTVPLGERPDLAKVGGLPWCSAATLHSDGEKLHRTVGRAIRHPDQWVLPSLYEDFDPSATLAHFQKEADKLRRRWGLNAVSSRKTK
jgi:hypothetical protein